MSRGARATIAVVALYALVLQAFLTGTLPVTSAQVHGFGEICAPADPGSEAPAKHEGKGCCTAACAPLAAPLPVLDVSTLAWPARSAVVAAFPAASPPPARGPPIHDRSARGPPLA